MVLYDESIFWHKMECLECSALEAVFSLLSFLTYTKGPCNFWPERAITIILTVKGILCKCTLLNKISSIKQALSLNDYLGYPCMNGLFKSWKVNVNNPLFYKVISLMVFLLTWLAVRRVSIDINGCIPMSSRTPPQLDKGKTCQPITAQCRLQLLPPFSETQYLPGRLGAVDSNGERRKSRE